MRNEREDLIWKEVKTDHLVQDEWMDLRRSTYQFPDGSQFGPFYTYSRRDYAVIVATDTEGNYLCVRQFRPGLGKVTTEFPAGGLERNDGREWGPERRPEDVEDALEAAKRELREETGYVSENWQPLIAVPSNATIADNYAYVFKAADCHKVSGQALDETEFLNVEVLSPEEIDARIASGDFEQAIHIMGLLLARQK